MTGELIASIFMKPSILMEGSNGLMMIHQVLTMDTTLQSKFSCLKII